MNKVFFIIVFISFCKISQGQKNNSQLIGTWKLEYSLQPNNDSCNLPKQYDIVTFFSNNTYSWQTEKDIVRGKWKTSNGRLQLFDNKAINFEGTVGNSNDPFEIKNGLLHIHLPEGGDISCPHIFYKKMK